MKPLTPQQAPDVSGAAAEPYKDPIEVFIPICPVPMPYPGIPGGPVLDDTTIKLDQ